MVHEFSQEAMREAGVQAGVPPFAVISSNTNDLSVGRCGCSCLSRRDTHSYQHIKMPYLSSHIRSLC